MQTAIEILKKFDLFGMLDTHELEKIYRIAEEVTCKKGESIVKEKIPTDSLFIIKNGCVRITKESRLIVILGGGSPIGELSFIDKGLPSATAIAEEDSTLIKIPFDAFDNLMGQDNEIENKVYKSIAVALCQKLRDTNEWLFTRDWLADVEKEAVSRRHF